MTDFRLGVWVLLGMVTMSGCGGESDDGDSRHEASGGAGGYGEGEAPPTGDVDEIIGAETGLCARRAAERLDRICAGAREGNCDPGCTYYLAANGDDSADGRAPEPGTSSGPWRSLSRLADVTLVAGDRICLRRGDEFYGQIAFPGMQHYEPAVVIQGYGDLTRPRPVISGARRLPNDWTPTAESPLIYSLDVGDALSQGTPYSRNGASYTPREKVYQFFVNGEIQTIARFPNLGEGESIIVGIDLAAGHYSVIDSQSDSDVTDAALPAASPLQTPTDLTGAVLFYKPIRWMIAAANVTAHDAIAHTLTTSEPLHCASDGNSCVAWGYMLLDHRGLLDAPGEWFYDDQSRRLYYWPPDGLDFATARFEASVYEADVEPPGWADASASPETRTTVGIDLGNTSGVEIDDVSIRFYSKTGVWGSSDLSDLSSDPDTSTTGIRVEGCEFLHTGASGVHLARWSAPLDVDARNVVTGNDFRGQVSQAVVMGTTDMEVSCSVIRDIGLLEEYPRFGMTSAEFTIHDQGMAIIAERADRGRVLYNRVQRTASAGLSLRSPGLHVAYNVFKDTCYTKSDCGAIHSYTWDEAAPFENPSISGTLIARNIVLNTIGSSEGCSISDGWGDPLGQGMFFDLGSEGFSVRQNVVAGSTSAGILHQVNHNVVSSENVLYDNALYNRPGALTGGLSVNGDVLPTNGTFDGNEIFTLTRDSIPLVVGGEDVAETGMFSGTLFFDPFAWETRTADPRWRDYVVYHLDAEHQEHLYSLGAWRDVSGDTDAVGVSMWWQSHHVTPIGDNLITNPDFSEGVEGWTTLDWSTSTVISDEHPVLGPCMRYDRNDMAGGGIGAYSNEFHLMGGHTYWVHFWVAPDLEGTGAALEPFTCQISESQEPEYVPTDRIREFTYLYTPAADEWGQLQLTPYPNLPDRVWIDDVVVQEVEATPYRNSAVVRFDEALPEDARTILIYNDSEVAVEADVVAGRYVLADGTPAGSAVEIEPYGAVVVVPVEWATSAEKGR